jgi:hypothetical protein
MSSQAVVAADRTRFRSRRFWPPKGDPTNFLKPCLIPNLVAEPPTGGDFRIIFRSLAASRSAWADVPCLDEAQTVGTCVQKALAYLEMYNVLGEVIVADNGRSDGSQAIAAGLGARVVPVSSLRDGTVEV